MKAVTVPSAIGYVPLENDIGRGGMIFFSRDAGDRSGSTGIRWGRIGMGDFALVIPGSTLCVAPE